MNSKKYLALHLVALILWSGRGAYAQGAFDSSAIPRRPTMSEPYGGNPIDSVGTGNDYFASRPHRLGASTGIGASSADTTSATAESSPLSTSSPVFKSNPTTYAFSNAITPQNQVDLGQTFSQRMTSPAASYEKMNNQLFSDSPALRGSGVSPGTFGQFTTPFQSGLYKPGAWSSMDSIFIQH